MFNYFYKKEINSCYDDISLKTEKAYGFYNQDLNYNKLIDMLNSDESDLQWFALLNIEKVQKPEDVELLLSCLKNDDSRIRELSSGLISNHIADPDYKHLFDNKNSLDILVNSITDVNPKVCRNIIFALQYINSEIILIEKIIKIIKTDNDYTIYWGLCALEKVLANIPEKTNDVIDKIIELICQTSKSKSFQIRERTAFIVKILNRSKISEKHFNTLNELINKLSNDPNFYVRNAN
jgi:hypothetical protein